MTCGKYIMHSEGEVLPASYIAVLREHDVFMLFLPF
jgi:hypothetical protein